MDDDDSLAPVLIEQAVLLIMELIKHLIERRQAAAEEKERVYDPQQDPEVFGWYRANVAGWPRAGRIMVEHAITGRKVRPLDRPRRMSELKLCALIVEGAPEQIQGSMADVLGRWGKLTVWED